MRATLHLVSSADYPVYAAAIFDARRGKVWRSLPARLVHLPPSGTYGFRRSADFIPYEEWVGPIPAMPREPMRHLVRRYLAAFGPATIDDMASWIGVPKPAIRAVLDEAPRTFRDEAGRLLYDVAASAAACRRHAGAGPPAPQVGLLPARLLAARAGAHPARALSQTGHRVPTETSRRRSSSTGSWRERGRSRRSVYASSHSGGCPRASAASSPPRRNACSSSSREGARPLPTGAEPGAAREAAAPRALDSVDSASARPHRRHPEPVRAERLHPPLVVSPGLPP